MQKKPTYIPYLIFVIITLPIWAIYLSSTGQWSVIQENWQVTLTMIFGSFIAGASSEGGGAIAYPVLTLLLDVAPASARNFSFAIQSIGMTAASLLIIGLRIPIEWRSIKWAAIGGIPGLIIGTFFVAPFVHPAQTKLIFVTIWLGFGLALWLINRLDNRVLHDTIIPEARRIGIKLIAGGFIGGVVTALFGNGIDIFTFCILVLYFGLNEKIATPTSVVLMTILTICGYFLHLLIGDFKQLEYDFWLAAIPVVIFGAPLGALVISKIKRQSIVYLLYAIMISQYIGALYVIQPSFIELTISLSFGLLAFLFFSWLKRKGFARSEVIQ